MAIPSSIGVGMTEFCKPRGEIDYPELAVEAATKVRSSSIASVSSPLDTLLIGRGS